MRLPSLLSLALLPIALTSALTPQSSFHIASDSFQADPVTLRTHTHSDGHTHFTHHAFPNHKIRIKETTGWCETTKGVRGWSGYLDVKDRDAMFFYFFESVSERGTRISRLGKLIRLALASQRSNPASKALCVNR